MREAAEEAEAELVALRGRLREWEEEETRAAELKVTLETTRDALDELRCKCVWREAEAVLREGQSGEGMGGGALRPLSVGLLFRWFYSPPLLLLLLTPGWLALCFVLSLVSSRCSVVCDSNCCSCDSFGN